MKKHFKLKNVIAALVLVLALVLTACREGRPHIILDIDPTTGAGTFVFYVDVDHNEVHEVDNNFGEEGYIQDVDGFVQIFANGTPDYVNCFVTDTGELFNDDDEYVGYMTFRMEFSFDSIADLNAKIKEIVTAEVWDGLGIGDISINETPLGDGMAEYTLDADTRILEAFGVWSSTLAFDDESGAFVKMWDLPENPSQMVGYARSTFTVTMGDAEESFFHSMIEDFSVQTTAAAGESIEEPVTEEPAVEEPAPQETVPDTQVVQESPKTGEANIIIIAAIALLLSAIGILAVKKRAKA